MPTFLTMSASASSSGAKTPQKSPGATATPPEKSPAKNVRMFHIIEKDEIDYTFSAFDNKGNLYVIIPECPDKIPHGKLVAKKSYFIRHFKEEGPVITIARYSVSSMSTIMAFPNDKLTGDMESRAKDLLREHGGISLASARSDRTKYN